MRLKRAPLCFATWRTAPAGPSCDAAGRIATRQISGFVCPHRTSGDRPRWSSAFNAILLD
jgi:hypothetical protein